jgi:Zn-finger protein
MFQKEKRYENKKILDSARDRDCTINLPGCTNNKETTVFCHLNSYEFGKGKGIKADDGMGFYGCQNCHDIYDSRVNHDFERDWLESQAEHAALKTIRIMLKEGILK